MRSKTYTLAACAFASALAVGSLFGCAGKQGSSEAAVSQAPAEQQVANDGQANANQQNENDFDSFGGQQYDEYDTYGGFDTYGDYEDEEDFTDFSDLTSFEAKTADGKTFTQKDFAKADVTLVNFWSIGCGACMDEMPQLAQLQKTLPSNVQVITVCTDEYATAEEVAATVKEAGFTGTTLVSGSGDMTTLINEMMYVPTTIAFDSTGKVVGTPIIGEPENVASEFTQLINEGLKQVGKDTINVAS
jgi:thiol-disulfide isomerase/thioredoxin